MPKFQLEFRCDQRWEGMRPLSPGKRHCDSCDKTVVDVSRMTESEVTKAYTSSGGELCVQGWFEQRGGALLLKPLPDKRRLSVLQPAALAAAMALAACNEPSRTPNDETSDASGQDADTDEDTDAGADLWSKAVAISNNGTPQSRVQRTPAPPHAIQSQPDTQSRTAHALRTWLSDTAAAARDAVETAISSAQLQKHMGRMVAHPQRLGGAIAPQPELLRGEMAPATDDNDNWPPAYPDGGIIGLD